MKIVHGQWSAAWLTSLEMEQKDFTLIRIRRHDNKSQETQVADAERIASVAFAVSMACYMDQKWGLDSCFRRNDGERAV